MLTNPFRNVILAVGGSNRGLDAIGMIADRKLISADALFRKAKMLSTPCTPAAYLGIERICG